MIPSVVFKRLEGHDPTVPLPSYETDGAAGADADGPGAAVEAPGSLEPLSLHLYWSLYLGVLSFWARDTSHNQEATLALLDRSIRLFCRALREE